MTCIRAPRVRTDVASYQFGNPWHQCQEQIGDILQTTLTEALARVLKRDGPSTQARAYNMHDAFTELDEYEQHVIETTARSPEVVRAEYLDRRQRDEFRLDTRVLTL